MTLEKYTKTIGEPYVFEGKPYFLHQREDGLFYIVSSVTPTECGKGFIRFSGFPLEIDEDIVEIEIKQPLRKIECIRGENFIDVVNDLRDFADRKNVEYVSYTKLNNGNIGYWMNMKNYDLLAVMPRLFEIKYDLGIPKEFY